MSYFDPQPDDEEPADKAGLMLIVALLLALIVAFASCAYQHFYP